MDAFGGGTDGGSPGHRSTTSYALGAALGALCNALEAHLIDPAGDPHFADAVLRVVAQGRADGLTGDQIVTAFRRLWGSDSKVFRAGTDREREALRQLVTSTLIAAFIDGGDPPHPSH